MDMGRKLGRGLCPLFGEGAGSPSNTMLPGPRPTCMPSFILIHLTVWPQYTNVADRTDRKDRTNRQTNCRPKIAMCAETSSEEALFHCRLSVCSGCVIYCLPVKSIAKAEGEWRPTTISRAGLITDERHIAPAVKKGTLVSAQYRILHSAPYDFCLMSDVYVSVNKNTVQ